MKPLDDILVVDFSRVLSGPYCSMYLGDFGARVVKLEKPGTGDDTRAFGPPFVAGEAAYYLSINRNKESVALDLRRPEAREAAWKLVERADVLLENFRPGAMDRLGFGVADAIARNPRLVYASISGFGHAGLREWSRRPGYDLIVQGYGGVASLTGPADGPPYKVGTAIGDLVAGLFSCIGILLALRARERTGKGQHVDVSMLDGQVSLLSFQAGIHFADGGVPRRHGNAHPTIVPYQTVRARDGWFNLGCGNDALFAAFCRVAGRPDLANDPRFATNADRVRNREPLETEIAPLLAARDVRDWIDALDAAGVPCGPVLNVAEALAHPQVRARDMVVELDHPRCGRVRATGVPVRLSDTPGAVVRPPPLLGEHTDAVLSEFGLSPAEIAALRGSGAAG